MHGRRRTCVTDEGLGFSSNSRSSTDPACCEQVPSSVWRAYITQVLPGNAGFSPAAAQIQSYFVQLSEQCLEIVHKPSSSWNCRMSSTDSVLLCPGLRAMFGDRTQTYFLELQDFQHRLSPAIYRFPSGVWSLYTTQSFLELQDFQHRLSAALYRSPSGVWGAVS